MFVLLGAAAANLMTLPVLQTGSLQPSFKAEMNRGGFAAIELRLVISAAGVPIHCTRTFANGPAGNVDAMCAMLQSTVRYAPAHDSSGRPAAGVIYVWSHWNRGRWTGSAMPSWDPVDLALGVNHMPKGFEEGSLFLVALQVDAAGKVESCAVSTAGLTSQAVDLLCSEAGTDPKTPATDESGVAVSSVQEFVIRLTSQELIDKLVKRLRRM